MIDEQSPLMADIRNYQWMLREHDRMVKEMKTEELPSKGLVNFKEVAGFGSSNKASSRLNEARNRYRKKIKRVNDVLDLIVNDRDYAIITCMLDGMNVKNTSEHIGVSRRTVYRTLEDLDKLEIDNIKERSKRRVLREIKADGS